MISLPSSLRDRILRSPLPPAVVVGTDVTGASVARALAAHGVVVIGLDDCIRKFVGLSRAFAHVHRMGDSGAGTGFRDVRVIETLESLAAALPRRAVLFLSMDHHVTIVGEHGQHLSDLYEVELAAPAAVELLMDKQRFTDFAVARGWPVPRSFSCDSDEAVARVCREAGFPVILKPKVKTPLFAANSKTKVYRCDTPDELVRTYQLVRQWEAGVLVQEWVPGSDDSVYFSFHYLARDGRSVSTFEGRKLRQFPPLCGNTTAAVPVAHPELEALSMEVLRESGAVGFCSVEYKRDPRDGRYFIMEPTIGRVNLQIGTAIANGRNIPWAAYRHLAGLPPEAEPAPVKPRTWVFLRNDLKSARYHVAAGTFTWREYLATLAGPKAFAVWRWNEYRMALAVPPHLLGRARRFLAKRLRRAAGLTPSVTEAPRIRGKV